MTVNIIYKDGKGGYYLLLYNSSGTCDRGWQYINNDQEVEICGTTCDTLLDNPQAGISVLFGCQTGQLPAGPIY